MEQSSLTERVDRLELAAGALTDVRSRVAAVEVRVIGVERQILQLRTEMKEEFSAARLEMHALHQEAMSQSRLLYEDLRDRIILLGGARKRPNGRG